MGTDELQCTDTGKSSLGVWRVARFFQVVITQHMKNKELLSAAMQPRGGT